VDEETTVNKKMLKAMSAEMRVSILKALAERQKTQTELAAELKCSMPTVFEHVRQLEDAELIEEIKDERERKWKYYSLTKTGRIIIEKRRANLIILLSSSLLLALGSSFLLISTLYPRTQAVGSGDMVTATSTSPSAILPLLGLIAFFIAVIAAISAAYLLLKKKY
jgi:DNA-binding MarR family transcriptional regulator